MEAKRQSFVCPVCRAESFHPMDIRHGYCGRCHRYTRAEESARVAFRIAESSWRAAAEFTDYPPGWGELRD